MMGYTYEYLSPDNFHLPSAQVVDGILAPDAQSFKAMVVRANDSLTVEGVSKLVQFARNGLPIVFAGGVPDSYVGTYNPIDLRKSRNSLREIGKLSNVHTTDGYLVASTLGSLGIAPRTRIVATQPVNATWFTQWRQANDTVYVYVYNDAMHIPQGGGGSNGSIEFQHVGVPYEYNAWTGEQTPVPAYISAQNTTTIPLQLAGNQSTIIAFEAADAGNAGNAYAKHLSELQDDVVGYTYAANGSLVLKTAETASTLSNWTLIVEHWDPPADLYNISGGAYKHNTTHQLPDLVSWQDIPGLQNVSSRGYYSTSFTRDPSAAYGNQSSADGAILDFGWVYDSLRATLNGHQLPPLDVTAPEADVKDYLVTGENRLEAVVGTPLGNVLIPIWYQLQTSGEGPGSPDASTVPPPVGRDGLQADVLLIPYAESVVN